jgi:hypothetical protein
LVASWVPLRPRDRQPREVAPVRPAIVSECSLPVVTAT